MNFIIDANNLAGKLGLLKEDDFDKKLIDLILSWLKDKQKTVVLVFDSLEPMGDRRTIGHLEVIYSPRDRYYKTADDKIVEIFTGWANYENLNNEYNYSGLLNKLKKDELYFVSDDLDLKAKVKNIQYNLRERIKIISNDEFISILNKGELSQDFDDEEDRGLLEDEIDEINDELLELWK